MQTSPTAKKNRKNYFFLEKQRNEPVLKTAREKFGKKEKKNIFILLLFIHNLRA